MLNVKCGHQLQKNRTNTFKPKRKESKPWWFYNISHNWLSDIFQLVNEIPATKMQINIWNLLCAPIAWRSQHTRPLQIALLGRHICRMSALCSLDLWPTQLHTETLLRPESQSGMRLHITQNGKTIVFPNQSFNTPCQLLIEKRRKKKGIIKLTPCQFFKKTRSI